MASKINQHNLSLQYINMEQGAQVVFTTYHQDKKYINTELQQCHLAFIFPFVGQRQNEIRLPSGCHHGHEKTMTDVIRDEMR